MMIIYKMVPRTDPLPRVVVFNIIVNSGIGCKAEFSSGPEGCEAFSQEMNCPLEFLSFATRPRPSIGFVFRLAFI